MPNHLEHVVRPSQSPQIRPGVPLQLFATAKIPQNDPQVWGSAGNSVFDLQAQEQVELPQPKWEDQRTFSTVKVKNPDDTSQSITTEQMTEYQGRPAKGAPGTKLTLRFEPPKDTEFTEVVDKNIIRRGVTRPD